MLLFFLAYLLQLVWSIHVQNFSQFYHDIIAFIYDSIMDLSMCFLYVYMLLGMHIQYIVFIWPVTVSGEMDRNKRWVKNDYFKSCFKDY